MNDQNFETVATHFDSALRHIEEAIGELEELNQPRNKDLLSRLYEVFNELELNLLEAEHE